MYLTNYQHSVKVCEYVFVCVCVCVFIRSYVRAGVCVCDRFTDSINMACNVDMYSDVADSTRGNTVKTTSLRQNDIVASHLNPSASVIFNRSQNTK